MDKKKRITKKVQRQLDILSKYYEIDYENETIRIELQYEKASDLFEMDVVTKSTPKFKTEILARISELLESIPSSFKVDFAIKVNDYEGIKTDNIVESFKDQLEMFNFQIYKEKSGRLLTAVILTLISVGILFVRRFLLNQGIIDDKVLLTEMLLIVGWVFLWEGVQRLFLNSDEYKDVSFRLIDHLKSFALIDKDDKVISSIDQAEIQKQWVKVSRREKNARRMLLIAGAMSFAIGIFTILNIVPSFFNAYEDWATFLMSAISQIAIGIIAIIGGIGACSLYCEYGKFQKAVPIVSYIYLIFDVAVTAVVIYSLTQMGLTVAENAAAIINMIITMASSILYFISYMLLRKAGRENGEEDVYKL